MKPLRERGEETSVFHRLIFQRFTVLMAIPLGDFHPELVTNNAVF